MTHRGTGDTAHLPRKQNDGAGHPKRLWKTKKVFKFMSMEMLKASIPLDKWPKNEVKYEIDGEEGRDDDWVLNVIVSGVNSAGVSCSVLRKEDNIRKGKDTERMMEMEVGKEMKRRKVQGGPSAESNGQTVDAHAVSLVLVDDGYPAGKKPYVCPACIKKEADYAMETNREGGRHYLQHS
ncbi:hypothetical protein M758_UG107400 [Ceratodon purpureus]|nr:hypothetical protein M758_UG107400 [Ceratodon purpureus]